MVQRGLVQRQAVVAAPIRVTLEQEHGDVALGTHDDHVGVGHGALHDGGAQVHGDEVQLVHCGHSPSAKGSRHALALSPVLPARVARPTSFQQADAEWRHLHDVAVVPDVASKDCGALRGEAAGVQLHDLLPRL